MPYLQLKYVDEYIAKRKLLTEKYRELLRNVNGISFLEDFEGIKHSYTYFPIFVDEDKFGKTRDFVYEELKKYNIFGRRYFYPLISQFPTYRGLPSAIESNIPIAVKISSQVICLPIYPKLDIANVEQITNIIKQCKN